MKVCCMLGEVSDVLEKVWGCYSVEVWMLLGVYVVGYEGDEDFLVL